MATFQESLQAIADAIRGKTGRTSPMTVAGMAQEIESISTSSEKTTTWSEAVSIVTPGTKGVELLVSLPACTPLEVTATLTEEG